MSETKVTKMEKPNCKEVTKELLFALTQKRELVPIEGLEYDIYVKLLSGFERRLFHKMMANDKTLDANEAPTTMIPVLIALCAVDACDNNIFGIEAADIKDIDKKLPSIIQNKIFGAAAKLNGLTDKSIDESVKN